MQILCEMSTVTLCEITKLFMKLHQSFAVVIVADAFPLPYT